MSKRIGALAPYYGCKRTLASTIVKALGSHSAYWEIPCGSMAVLFAKEESSHETVVDLHGDVTNLAWVLQSDQWEELYSRSTRAILNEDLFRHACKEVKKPCPKEPDLERAYWFLLRSWWGRNGITGTHGKGGPGDSLAVRFTPGGGHGGIRWRSVADSMPWWHQRLRSVVVLRRDLFKVLPKIDDKLGVVIYADPPYLAKTVRYVHDFTDEQHQQFAGELRRFKKARVVVSYYDDPRLELLYSGWQKICVATTKLFTNGASRKKGRVEAPEVLLVNQPVDLEPSLFMGV